MAYITGTASGETLTGTEEADTIYGFGGNDVINGLGGDDKLYGSDGADTLRGGAGADSLAGGVGSDDVDGGDGDDVLIMDNDQVADLYTGGAGADRFDTGLDMFSYGFSSLANMDRITDFSASEGDRVDIHASRGQLNGTYLIWYGELSSAAFSLKEGDALPTPGQYGFRGVSTWTDASYRYLIIDIDQNGVLGAGDFVLKFDAGAPLSKEIIAGDNGWTLVGSSGSDSLTGTAAGEALFGFAGADTLAGLGGADRLVGGAGDDELKGGDGADILYGGEGSDTLYGDAGDDFLQAAGDNGGGAYAVDAKDSVNKLYGGDGNDQLYGGEGKDLLEGGAGDDLLSAGASYSGTAGDILRGGDGDDDIYGGKAILDGGAGNDKLTMRAGSTLTGGAGADLFWTSTSYAEHEGYWPEDGFAVITDFKASEGDRLGLGEINSYGAILVFRGAVDTANFALEEGKTFSADDLGPAFTQVWTWSNAGNTYLFIDSDNNGKLTGNDTIVKLLGDIKLTAADFSAAYFSGVLGTAGADTFTGGDAADRYFAAGGADEVHGGAGDDYLYGNNGDDRIWGDAGGDRIWGGEGQDVIEGGAGNDHLHGGLGGDTIRGGDGSDNIYANDYGYGVGDTPGAINIIFGDGGDDYIIGASRLDQLHGGDGADTIQGAGEIWGDAGGDSLTGATTSGGGLAIIHGGDGNDAISGGYGDAILWGDAGWDRIGGGMGNDVLNVELGDSYADGGWGDDRILIGGLRAGDAPSLAIASGGLGDDTLVPLTALTAISSITLSGDEGVDTADFSYATAAVTADLSKLSAQDTGMGAIKFVGVENLVGGAFGSTLAGDAKANVLTGGASVDTLSGGAGRDVLKGGGGDDALDGGDDVDTAYFSGKWSDYTLSASNGVWTIKDNRVGSPDGNDTLKNVEFARFQDRVVANNLSLSQTVDTAFSSILRASPTVAMLSNTTADLVIKLAAGVTDADVTAALVKAAGATTSVSTLAYQFFTGKIPTEAGIDYLVSPTGPNANNLNSAYYQSFNLENRYINFAVALGKMGEGKDAFAAKYGALSFVEATREAYKTIFGGTPTDDKIHAMIDTRVGYFAAYGGDGPDGVGTKAAMVGWLLAEAQKADLGVMVRANDAWLTDLADGSAPFAIDLIDPAKGYYKAYYAYSGG